MGLLLEFSHSQLAMMSSREVAVANAYFTRKNPEDKLEFFRKVQSGRKDLLDVLHNMAWDMWHIRLMELKMASNSTKEARYFFSALLTFDKGLIELINLYPLKSCAFKVDGSQLLPFYDGDWIVLLAEERSEAEALFEKYFSGKARVLREEKRDNMTAQLHNMKNLIAQLEHELQGIAKIFTDISIL